jgi:hypothetical protein
VRDRLRRVPDLPAHRHGRAAGDLLAAQDVERGLGGERVGVQRGADLDALQTLGRVLLELAGEAVLVGAGDRHELLLRGHVGPHDALLHAALGEDAVDVAVARQEIGHDLLRLAVVPLAVRLVQHLDARVLLEHAVEAGGLRGVDRVARETAQDHDVALAVQQLDEALHAGCAELLTDGLDLDGVLRRDAVVGRDDDDAGLLGRRDGRVQAGLGVRVEDDRVDVLGDHAVDGRDLSCNAGTGVVDDQLLDLALDGRERHVGLDLGLELHACAVAVVAVREPDRPWAARLPVRGARARSAGDRRAHRDGDGDDGEGREGHRPLPEFHAVPSVGSCAVFGVTEARSGPHARSSSPSAPQSAAKLLPGT